MSRRLALATKAAPGQPFGGRQPTDPAADDSPMPGPADEVVHEWAGDEFEDAQSVTDPAEAFAHFSGVEGEEAWLDRADDGTLTGWVRDADQTVYRYSDADAWAVDVDDADMSRADSPDPDGDLAPEPEPGDDGEQPVGMGDATDGGDGGLPPGEEADPAEPEPDGDGDEDEEADPSEPEPDDDEDDEDDLSPFPKKKGVQGKSLALRVTPRRPRDVRGEQ